MNNVELHPAAYAEYQAALVWYAKTNTELAEQFEVQFQYGISKIALEPDIYCPIGKRHRFYRLHQFPYLLVYRNLGQGKIRVVAVSHKSRKPGYWHRR